MSEKKLSIIGSDNKPSNQPPQTLSSKATQIARKKAAQAIFERQWLIDPEQFNPLNNSMGQLRMARTKSLIKEFVDLPGKQAADLGCGWGVLAHFLQAEGATVTAVDIAENALKLLRDKEEGSQTPDQSGKFPFEPMQIRQEALPATGLKEDTYDLVVCTDVIAEIDQHDYRLLIAELSHIAKKEGHIVLSTPLDIYSEDAVERLIELVKTELHIDKAVGSYHYLFIRLADTLKAPARFYRAWKNRDFRQSELRARPPLTRWWFRLNSTPIPASLWFIVGLATTPLAKCLEKSKSLLLGLEKLSHFLLSTRGLSHIILSGKRRPLEPLIEKSASETKLFALAQRKERKWE